MESLPNGEDGKLGKCRTVNLWPAVMSRLGKGEV